MLIPTEDGQMKVYLAAGFARKQEIAEKSQELRSLGIMVTSTWPYEDMQPDAKLNEVTDEYWAENARRDLNEILAADALILFTHDPLIPFCRGGRMHEAGFAQGSGKTLLVCGPKENIFHWLPEVNQFDTWEALKETLVKAILV
jgi:nucleoside 2-deoxyribosyltransferase